MVQRSVDQLTLRELVTGAERLTRELLEHLEKGFLPKSQQLSRLVRAPKDEPLDDDVEDVTIRNHAARLLKSEDFSEELFNKVNEYWATIDKSVARLLGEDEGD